MTIIDACPTRDQDRIHRAVRILAEKMNIRIVEASRTKREGTCCGDSLFGRVPTEQVVARMKAKALEMPLDEILVYCVSCSKAVSTGDKRPRHLIDLLFGEDAVPGVCHPDLWHEELQEYIDSHVGYEIA